MAADIRDVVQKARLQALQNAYRRAEQIYSRESGPDSKAIRNLGLLNQDADTKQVLDAVSKAK